MLLLIDLQNDYFDPQGKFYFPAAKEMAEALIERIRRAKESGEAVLYTLNIYTDKDERSIGERDWAASLFEPFKEHLQGEQPLKKLYYGISSEEAGKIKERFKNNPPDRIEVAGVETQLCVMANAVIVQNMYPDAQVVVSRRLSKSSDPGMEDKAFEVMLGMKIEVIG